MSARPDSLGPISVVVVNYDGREHLPPCLEALTAQTRAVDELIVVDNASTDGSPELVRERWPGARLIELAENQGPCPARNAGMRAARNRWVLLVDNDAVARPDVLAKLERALLEHPGAVLAQPRSVFADDPERVHYDGGRFHYAGLFSLRNFGVPIERAEGRGTLEVDGAVSVLLLVDRDELLEAGGFDEGFFILFEDLDLSYRLRLAGKKLLSVEDALVLHRGGTSGISFRGGIDYPRRRAFFHSRNRWLFLAKNYSLLTLFVAAPGLLAYELVWSLFTLLSGTFGGYVEGKLAFLRQFGDARRARRQIQGRRRVRDRELLVGGPLTLSPQLVRRGPAGLPARLLDGFLRLWWGLARHLAG